MTRPAPLHALPTGSSFTLIPAPCPAPATDVAALAGSHARHAAQIRNLSAETTRLRSYATELEGVAADLRRELAVSRESVAELSDALDRARADAELAERSRALQVGDRCRLRGPGPIWSRGEAVEIEQVSASAMVRFDSGGRLRVSADELERLAPTAPPTAGATAPVSPALPLGPKPGKRQGLEALPRAVDWTAAHRPAAWRAAEPAARALVGLPEDGPPEEALPRVVEWRDLEPGDLALDVDDVEAPLLRAERRCATWRYHEGEHYVRVERLATGQPLGTRAVRAVLLARGVPKRASAIREAYERQRAAAEALADEARRAR